MMFSVSYISFLYRISDLLLIHYVGVRTGCVPRLSRAGSACIILPQRLAPIVGVFRYMRRNLFPYPRCIVVR